MKINKILRHLPLLAVALLAACDSVDEENRYLTVQLPPVERNVLLEDYTGQMCVNCPDAHELVEKMKSQYGNHLIPVSIHAGGMSIPAPNGLAQSFAADYLKKWGIDAFPMGVINRRGGKQNADKWAALVADATKAVVPTASNPSVGVQAEAQVEEGELVIHTQTTADGVFNVTGKLQVWVVENAISTIQMMQDGKPNLTYQHNHVLRSAVNGTWGEDVNLSAGETEQKDYRIALTAANVSNAANAQVVVFVYNDGGVLNVTACDVK